LVSPGKIFLELLQQCPHCGSRRLARSRRRNLAERWLGVMMLPYRCVDCDLRLFQFRSEKAAQRWQRLESAWKTLLVSGARKAAG
jgi:DNA-directed RNA polymerase subunit RPC12/RpoP